MTVKRYTPTQCCEHDGTYVTYSDYQKLVAENVGLNIDRLAWAELYADTVGDHPLYERARELPTPATEAAIAEIKAQGVDDFAEYIVSSNRTVQNLYSEMQAISFAANLRAGRKG